MSDPPTGEKKNLFFNDEVLLNDTKYTSTDFPSQRNYLSGRRSGFD